MKKYIVITNSGSKKFDGDKYAEAVNYAKAWIPSGIYELITTVSHADPIVIDLRRTATSGGPTAGWSAMARDVLFNPD